MTEETPEAFGERRLDALNARYDPDHVKQIYLHDNAASRIESLRKLSEVRVHLEYGEKLGRSMLRKEEKPVEKTAALLSAAKTRVAKKEKKEFGDWNVSNPGSELSGGTRCYHQENQQRWIHLLNT